MKKPPLSVGILTYNHGMYLEDCLASVHALNKYFDLELVIVDDGSTDDSQEIFEKWSQLDIPYKLFMNSHQGIEFINLNTEKIIEECSNDCVVTLAGDDVVMPEQIKMAYYKYWNDNTAIVYGNGLKLLEHCPTNNSVMNDKTINALLSCDPHKVKNFLMVEPPLLFLQGALLRRSFMIEHDVYRHGLIADDWMINYRIFSGLCKTDYQYSFTNTPLFYHRLHSNNTSRDLFVHYNRIKEVLLYFDQTESRVSLLKISAKYAIKSALKISPRLTTYFSKETLLNLYRFLYAAARLDGSQQK